MLAQQVVKLACQGVILLVFEDVHWIDPTSLEALDQIIAAIGSAPVLVIITFRPEFTPQWRAHSHVTLHSLNRLGKRQSGQLVERVTGGKPLPKLLHDQIISKTDGVPLFIEELTKAVIESDMVSDEGDRHAISGTVDSLAIPDTLHDSLMARLDKLIPVKEVAQIGAAIGREFSYQLIVAVSSMSEMDLDAALDKLVASQLVFRRGSPPEATYTFKHALVQDAAYDSLLKRDRQDLHREIAEALLEYFPAVADTEPELLAHHFTLAELAERAVPYWLSAGQMAVQRSAFVDASAHLIKGLDLLGALPSSDDRDRQELNFQVLLMPVHITTTGWITDALSQTASRARELAERFGEMEMLKGIWHVLWMVRCAPARYREALEVADQAVRAGEVHDVSAFRVVGHFSAACTHGWMGEFARSQDEMRAVVADYDFDRHKDIALSTNHDPLNSILSYWCHFYWMTGHPDMAKQTAFEQVDMARHLNHPFNTIFALSCGGCAFVYRNEPDLFSEWIAEASKIAEEQALDFAMAFISAFSGMGLIWSGHYEEGHQKVAQCVDMFTAAGIGLMVPMYQTNMSHALGQMECADDGLELIGRAIEQTARTGERFYAAETHRIKGELLLDKCREGEAEAAFQESLGIAAEQGAKGWELRTAMSLARLRRRQNKVGEAHDVLAPVYDWFTEGFDTRDLMDAKALLDELR